MGNTRCNSIDAIGRGKSLSTYIPYAKKMVHFYYTDETINQFAIGYMINPSFNFNKVSREQVEKYLSSTFHDRTMETIRDCMRSKNTCVMALIMFYENNGVKQKIMYRLLRCILYTIIDTYVFIDYLSCQSKTLSTISSKPTFEQTSFNILLGIGITELLLNL